MFHIQMQKKCPLQQNAKEDGIIFYKTACTFSFQIMYYWLVGGELEGCGGPNVTLVAEAISAFYFKEIQFSPK